jgi:NAD(P)H-quinone oxidoreductase subunit 5
MNELCEFNNLNIVLSSLIALVTIIVAGYSRRYLDGNKGKKIFYLELFLISLAVIAMVCTTNIVLFVIAWLATNGVLIALMTHQQSWQSAKNAGALAAGHFIFAGILMTVAAVIMVSELGTYNFRTLINNFDQLGSTSQILVMVGILGAALVQSAQFPFHKWLLSSMNAPTPVSALMHAGVVNGGGILLVKFQPVVTHHPVFMNVIFTFGAVTALLGALWMFVRNSVKGNLVCSTISQMGFMTMQIGLGLFPAAISHLCMHGFYKAFHFLAAGYTLELNSDKEINLDSGTGSKLTLAAKLALSALIGLVSTAIFAWAAGYSFNVATSSFILLGFVFMALTQLAISVMTPVITKLRVIASALAVPLTGLAYGGFIHLFDSLLHSSTFNVLYTPGILHYGALAIFFSLWLGMNLSSLFKLDLSLVSSIYMKLLNASHSARNTNTTSKRIYK